MKFDILKMFVVCAAALCFLGCTGVDKTQEVALPVEFDGPAKSSAVQRPNITAQQAKNFSTSGKATRPYSTPNGPIYLYDISKDPEVVQAIETLYAQGGITFGDVSFKEYYEAYYNPKAGRTYPPEVEQMPAALLLAKAREIAYYDLYRASCKKVERVPCGDGNSGWGPRYVSECPSCNLGKLPDSDVEEIWFNYNRVVEKRLTEDDIAKGRYPKFKTDTAPTTAYLDECPHISKEPLLKYFYIGEKSGYTLEEAKNFLLHYDCTEW